MEMGGWVRVKARFNVFSGHAKKDAQLPEETC
jgi:hypothetical protein